MFSHSKQQEPGKSCSSSLQGDRFQRPMFRPFGAKHAPDEVDTINPERGELNLFIDPAFNSGRGEAGNRQVWEEAFAGVASRTGQEPLHEAFMQIQELGRAVGFHDHGPGLVSFRKAYEPPGCEFKWTDAAACVLKRLDDCTCCPSGAITEEECRAMHLLNGGQSMWGQCQRAHKARHGFRDLYRGIEGDEESLHSSLALGHSSNGTNSLEYQKR